jgi:hypothetical protein
VRMPSRTASRTRTRPAATSARNATGVHPGGTVRTIVALNLLYIINKFYRVYYSIQYPGMICFWLVASYIHRRPEVVSTLYRSWSRCDSSISGSSRHSADSSRSVAAAQGAWLLPLRLTYILDQRSCPHCIVRGRVVIVVFLARRVIVLTPVARQGRLRGRGYRRCGCRR